MNFETAERRAIEMLNAAKRFIRLVEEQKDKSGPFLLISVVLCAVAIETYTNALIWLRIIEKDNQQLLKAYTCVEKGERKLERKSIRVKVKEWTKRLTGKSFGDSALIKKFGDLIDLRNKIVHYQIEKLDEKQLKKFRENIPYHLVKKGKEVSDQKKIEQSIRKFFFHDYLTDEITLERTHEAIKTAREVMVELNRCYYNFVPWWLR